MVILRTTSVRISYTVDAALEAFLAQEGHRFKDKRSFMDAAVKRLIWRENKRLQAKGKRKPTPANEAGSFGQDVLTPIVQDEGIQQ